MINPNELRIGNYVMDKVSCEWMIVDEIGDIVGATLINRDKYPLADGWEMSPIPLTPEILEKCGFVSSDCEMPDNSDEYRVWKDYYNGEFGIDYYHCGVDGRPDLYVFEWEEGNKDMKTEIKHLHQLQNIYFALTGEELTVNL